MAIWKHKWGVAFAPWTAEHHAVRSPLIPSYVMYPYFEKDVEGLCDKGYIVAEEEAEERWMAYADQLRGAGAPRS
jgi:hypothetical protein